MAENKGSLDPETLARLGSLEDPVRRRLYEFVLDCDHPAGRDEAAAATGISRTLAAYHLDKLADAGLLRADYARPEGRNGPGSGRPAKIYSRGVADLTVSVPPRNDNLLARLLVSALDHDPTGVARESAVHEAHEAGAAIGADSNGNLLTALSGCGYQPRVCADGSIELCNCPFHAQSDAHRSTVCNLNLNIIQGMLDATHQPGAQAELDFRPNRCCVVIHYASTTPAEGRSATE